MTCFRRFSASYWFVVMWFSGSLTVSDVALVVVGVLGGLVLRAELLEEAVQAVVDAASLLRERVCRVAHFLCVRLPIVVQRVDDAVAEVVRDLR